MQFGLGRRRNIRPKPPTDDLVNSSGIYGPIRAGEVALDSSRVESSFLTKTQHRLYKRDFSRTQTASAPPFGHNAAHLDLLCLALNLRRAGGR